MNALEKALRFTVADVPDIRTYDHGFDAVPCVSWIDGRGVRVSVAFYGANGEANRDSFVERRLGSAA